MQKLTRCGCRCLYLPKPSIDTLVVRCGLILQHPLVFSAQSLGLNLKFSTSAHWRNSGVIGTLDNDISVSKNKTETKIYIPHTELVETLEKQRALSAAEWDELKSKLIGVRNITESSFEGNVMGGCIQYENYAAGKSLIEYIRSRNMKPNIATLSRYMRLCGDCYEKSGEDEIVKCYSELQKIAPVLDVVSLEHVISALSKTSHWRECLNLIEEIKLVGIPRGLVYNRVAAAAFAHNEIELGWSLLETLVSANRPVASYVCLQWLQLVEKAPEKKAANEMLDRFVDYCARHQLSLPMEVTEGIKHCMQRKGAGSWQGDYTSIQVNGICRRCESSLDAVQINDEEFAQLREVFMKNVITGSNPYSKTSLKELENYKNFISRTAPYDVVIDGLNVAFYEATKKTTVAEKAGLLRSMVKDLVEAKNARVLVLGRAHMSRWPQRLMSYVQKNAYCFFANNLSKDDPFVLYAAMYSGLGTYVVSRDLMRDHKYCLHSARLSSLFRRWQLCQQLGFTMNPETGKFNFMPPVKYNPVIQKTDSCLHIPCTELDHPEYTCDLPIRWLCMSKSSLHDSRSMKPTRVKV